jgi:hypothetical protein
MNTTYDAIYNESAVNLSTMEWSDVTTLRAVYVNSEKEYIFTIDDNNNIRRMKISRDKDLARIVFAKAKSCINKMVVFGAVDGWSPDEWFSDLSEVE